MALKVGQAVYQHTDGEGATFSIPITPAAAGNRLVLTFGGGAIATSVRLTDGSGAEFDMRVGYGGGSYCVQVGDITATGGETAVHVTLNGDRTCIATVYEMQGDSIGDYIGGGSNGSGSSLDLATDLRASPTAAITVPSSAVLFATFLTEADPATRPYGDQFRFRQFGPLGAFHAEGGAQPGNGESQFLWASAIADIDETRSYPPELAAGQYKATTMYLTGGSVFAAQAAYEDLSNEKVNPPLNPVVAENSLPGTHKNNWYIGSDGTNANICGYTDKVSYSPGDTVSFKVDSDDSAFRVEVYRLGHYGWDIFAARNVIGSGHIAGTVVTQPAPTTDPITGATSCSWTTNAMWTIPTDAAPGVYYCVFRRNDISTLFASTHFTVKGDPAGKVNVVTPDLTHAAYNLWGAPGDNGPKNGTWSGRSLYQSGLDGNASNFAHRAYATSFDRPWSIQSTQLNTYLFDAPHAVIAFAEAQGFDLNYLSDIDLDADPHVLDDGAVTLMLGHHEYWTTNVYDAYTNAVTAGVNLLVDSSNTGLWHVRFDAGDTDRRTMICYKESGTKDVSAGFTGTGYDPVSYTGTWRDTRTISGEVNNPDIRPENILIGQMFKINGSVSRQTTVPYAMKGFPLWRNSPDVQALTTGQVYTTPTAVLGDEIDFPDGSATEPNLVKVTTRTDTFPLQGANAAGSIYTLNTGPIELNYTLHRADSGALVFCTGSWRGLENVSVWHRGDYRTDGAPDLNWQNMVLALMFDFGATPTTVRSLRPGVDLAPTDPAIGAPVGGNDGVAAAYGLTDAPAATTSLLAFFMDA